MLVVANSLSAGGAERFTSVLLHQLDRTKFTASLCLLRGPITYPVPDDIDVSILDKQRPWHIVRTVGRLRRLIEEFQPQVVLSTIAFVNLVTGMALRHCAIRTRWIARIGNDPHREERWDPCYLNRYVYPRADKFVVISHGLEHAFIRRYPFAKGHTNVIYCSADFSYIERMAGERPDETAPQGIPMIFCAGRLARQKRPDLLLRAFAMVRQRMPVVLWHCGDGPMRGKMRKLVRSLGLEDSCRLFGFRKNPYALMRQAALFILTSDHEGLCNALVESQGMGVPAVATDCPYGPNEVVADGETGVLVEVGDVDAMAVAIEMLLKAPDRRAEMSRAAALRSREIFGVEAIGKQWDDILGSC